MLTAIRAIYEQGRLRLLDPVELTEGQQVSVTIQPVDELAATRAALGDSVIWSDPTSGDPKVDEEAMMKIVEEGFKGTRPLSEIIIEEREEGW